MSGVVVRAKFLVAEVMCAELSQSEVLPASPRCSPAVALHCALRTNETQSSPSRTESQPMPLMESTIQAYCRNQKVKD